MTIGTIANILVRLSGVNYKMCKEDPVNHILTFVLFSCRNEKCLIEVKDDILTIREKGKLQATLQLTEIEDIKYNEFDLIFWLKSGMFFTVPRRE